MQKTNTPPFLYIEMHGKLTKIQISLSNRAIPLAFVKSLPRVMSIEVLRKYVLDQMRVRAIFFSAVNINMTETLVF